MEKTLVVAKYLYDEYIRRTGSKPDEMRMHKLMYLIQREAIMYNEAPMFEEPFLGWKYGPVLRTIRDIYNDTFFKEMFDKIKDEPSIENKKLINSVIDRYRQYSSWDLSVLSHNEFSWNLSRWGLKPIESGNKELNMNAMKVDALKELDCRKEENLS